MWVGQFHRQAVVSFLAPSGTSAGRYGRRHGRHDPMGKLQLGRAVQQDRHLDPGPCTEAHHIVNGAQNPYFTELA